MAGIYIHIPFCRQACTYCNFHFSTSLAQKADFLNSLVKEINKTELFISPSEVIETIYFGGGTPSLLNNDELKRILETVRNKFFISHHAEITLEANPDDINKNTLKQWLDTGINRLSLGVQSFKQEELIWMNRAHTPEQSLISIDEIHASGFINFSVDLIYGSPLSDNKDLETHLEIIYEKKIPHISCYALTVEPKTILNTMISQKKTLPINNEKQSEQFLLLMKTMNQNDYEHYEISNFAKPGMRSKHNSSYWQRKPYYGFGPAAHSFDGKNKRRWNIANNAIYIQSVNNNIVCFEEEVLTDIQKMNEYIMISLRTMEGLNVERIKKEFGHGNAERTIITAQKYIVQNKLVAENGNLKLTNEGKLFADGIAADLFL